MPAVYEATLQYYSYARISIPLPEITFCFHTASSGAVFVIAKGPGHTRSFIELVIPCAVARNIQAMYQ
jgi:hypothetical protein